VRARVLQVGAGAERATLLVPRQDDTADFGVVLQFRETLAEAGLKFLAPGIACLRATEGQDGDGTTAFAK
jgi:hypothetical protein